MTEADPGLFLRRLRIVFGIATELTEEPELNDRIRVRVGGFSSKSDDEFPTLAVVIEVATGRHWEVREDKDWYQMRREIGLPKAGVL
ncbi:MAG: hypothetical protein ACR2PL_05930 [Dehalococcoidia bacterium]